MGLNSFVQYSCWSISVARQTRRAFTLAYTPITSPLLIRAVTTVNLTVVECTELLVSPRTKSLLLPHTRASPSRSAKGLLQISQELIKRLLQPHETARVELQICKSHAQFARNLLVSVRRSPRSFPQFHRFRPTNTTQHAQLSFLADDALQRFKRPADFHSERVHRGSSPRF